MFFIKIYFLLKFVFTRCDIKIISNNNIHLFFMICVKNINIKLKLKKKKPNNGDVKLSFLYDNDNIFIKKIKKMIKIMMIIISFILIIIFMRYCYCNYKIYKLNKKIKNDIFETLNLFNYNLESILWDTKKINSINLTPSQIMNMEHILKLSAESINFNIISNNNGIVTEDGYIGIYNYIYENFGIKKCINKKIPINYFFSKNGEKLVEKKFDINYYSFELIKNICEIFTTINK